MPVLDKEHWEQACIHYVRTGNKTDSYRTHIATKKLSDNVLWKSAHEFFKHPKVAVRVKELKQELSESANYAMEDNCRS